jgi:hypothetical protein
LPLVFLLQSQEKLNVGHFLHFVQIFVQFTLCLNQQDPTNLLYVVDSSIETNGSNPPAVRCFSSFSCSSWRRRCVTSSWSCATFCSRSRVYFIRLSLERAALCPPNNDMVSWFTHLSRIYHPFWKLLHPTTLGSIAMYNLPPPSHHHVWRKWEPRFQLCPNTFFRQEGLDCTMAWSLQSKIACVYKPEEPGAAHFL